MATRPLSPDELKFLASIGYKPKEPRYSPDQHYKAKELQFRSEQHEVKAKADVRDYERAEELAAISGESPSFELAKMKAERIPGILSVTRLPNDWTWEKVLGPELYAKSLILGRPRKHPKKVKTGWDAVTKEELELLMRFEGR